MALQAGDTIGAYEIVGTVGRGGMATVYQAYHERLDRHVAIKLMHETFLQDEDFRARFQREARIVAKLEHPSIVPIYDYDVYEGTPYLVMKYIAGMTLKKRALKTGLTLEETGELLKVIAGGLDYAHTSGILHRDMKPSNILIDKNEQAYITDFGLARIAEAGASTISHDMMLGTPFYISPEQAQGQKELDSRTDIYSLAVILYELITGRVPFEADTPYAIIHGHIYSEPEAPSYINHDLSLGIDTVLLRGLAKDPEERYPTATELIDAYLAALKKLNDEPSEIASAPSIVSKTPESYSQFDDLGDQFIARNTPPAQRQIPQPHDDVRVDAEFDMGDVRWGELGNRLRDGVTSFAEMIEERIDTELRHRRGIELTEEEIVRRRVLKKMQARRDFVGNLSSYIGVNAVLVIIWAFTGASFFWPIFPIIFWGMGVVANGYEYYSKYGPGAMKRRDIFEDEVSRELERRSVSVNRQEFEQRAKRSEQRLGIDDINAGRGGVRLNDEGELTDSFIDEQRGSR